MIGSDMPINDALAGMDIVSRSMHRSHGWGSREILLVANAAELLAKTGRVVRHKEFTTAA